MEVAPFNSGGDTLVARVSQKGWDLVLRLVDAPCPSIGEEGRIAWAEGGPVNRNGAEVERSRPAVLSRHDVGLVPQTRIGSRP
jgi:hypothetical protein